ncbi:MAG TPA: Wzz/FepE/Etk N-terminal domain-containing protein [Sphingomicrobium sp.]
MHSVLDWMDAIRFRWKLVALLTVALLGGALLYLALAPRTYTATASLLLDTQAPDPVEQDSNGEGNARSIMATQADLIRSPQVAGQAAQLSGLDKDAAFVAEWQEQTDGRAPYGDWLKARMLAALTVAPGKDTNILVIHASADSPAEAARIANGFAKASVASQFKLRTEPAKAYAAWLASRMVDSRGKVIEAQRTLSAFVQRTGLAAGEDLSSEGSQAAEVATQLAAAEARAAGASQSTYAAPQSRGDAERSATVQQIRQQLAERSAKLAELQSVFGPEYPDVKRTQAELSTLQGRLNSEVANATGAFSAARNAESAAERQAALASERRLRALASQQRARVQSMGTNVAQYTTLKNEFDAAQSNYNDLNQRLSKMRLQSAVPLTEVQVLDSATPFLTSSSPDPVLTLTLSVLLGLLLGAITAIVLEYLNPRVRSWGGIERLLGVQVVGRLALPKPAARRIARPTGPYLLEARAS